MELSGLWWSFNALYFFADVILFTAVIAIRKPGPGVYVSPKWPLWHYASEVVPFLFLLHLAYLTSEYRISARLDSVGLGNASFFMYIGVLIAIAACLFRSFEMMVRPEETTGCPTSEGRN